MLFSQDIAIDLGTSNTVVFVKGKGIESRQPSVVAVNISETPASVVAVGARAKEMIGRTPGSVVAMSPLRDGVIADFDVTVQMVKAFIQKALGKKIFAKARVVLCIPSGISEVERRNMHDVAVEAGARYVSLIEAPMAAAIGANLPVTKPIGSMIVDIGGGTSEVAVISLGDIVTSCSIRIAGNTIDETIINYIRKKYNLLIGKRAAEDIKIKIGSAYPYPNEGQMDVKGRNLLDGLPKTVPVTAKEIREAIDEPVSKIIENIKMCLEKTPPELSSDIIKNGIVLSGGTSLLRGLDKRIAKETKINVVVADKPEDTVAHGAGIFLKSNVLRQIGKTY